MKYRSFTPDTEALFIKRPNRFVVIAQTQEANNRRMVKVHCPNPGRLREILLPGRKLFLEKSSNPQRKTEWTLAAAEYRNTIIPLFSSRANGLIGELVLPELFPEYTVSPEQTLGSSRLDWLLQKNSEKIWVEVKACTLVEKQRALFPDAPSSRAVKHLEELSRVTGSNSDVLNTARVFFTVMNPAARMFSPNPHTDPEFCKALGRAVDSGVAVNAVSVKTGIEGFSTVQNMSLPIDLSSVRLAEQDSGAIIRIWENRNNYQVSCELHENSLSKAEKRKVRLPEKLSMNYQLLTSFSIRGDFQCFEDMEEELSLMNFSSNPAQNPEFLDWVSDYRHRRVFLHNHPAGVVTSMH